MRFRPGFRQQQRILAQAALAEDQTVADSKLADPSVHAYVKRGILARREWAASVKPARKRAKAGASGTVLERDVLKAVLRYLQYHPKVAAFWRQNAGALAGTDGQFIRLGPRGISDIIGYLNDGRFLACEVKAPTGTVQPHQQEFLDAVRAAGGVAFVARSVEDVERGLA